MSHQVWIGGSPLPIAPTISDLLEAARARLDRLEPEAAHRAIVDDGAVLVDTRCSEARRERGRVPGALEIPLSVLYWRVGGESAASDPRLADHASRIVLLCAHGYSSSMAAATLQDLGFPGATDVIGGFDAWEAAGLPVEVVSD